jgi:uncharacterized lipoprotein YmbA
MKNRVCFGAISGAFLLMVLLFAACSSTPPVKYYTLNTLPEMQQDVSEDASSDQMAVGLGPMVFPKSLNRPQIVIRQSPNRVEVSEFHRWASPLQGDFLRVLAKNISILLPMSRVAVYPWKDQFSPTYRIKLNVEQFDGQFGTHVILDVTWSVAKQKDTNEPVVKNSLIKEPVSTEDYEAIVAAKSRALAVLSQEIVLVINTISKKGSD